MASTLAQRLKELRVRNGYSLQQIADAVGASKGHVWELETGKSKNPSVELLTKLANHYEVGIAALMGEDPSATQEEPELVALFRDLKELSERDREVLKSTIQTMKKHKGGGA